MKKPLINIIILIFVALLSAMFAKKTFASQKEINKITCHEFSIDNNEISFPITSNKNKENEIKFLSTDKIFSFTSETCFLIINRQSIKKDILIWLENPRAYHAEMISYESDKKLTGIVTKGILYPLYLWGTTGSEIVFNEAIKPGETKHIIIKTGSIPPYNTQVSFYQSNILPEKILYQRIISAILIGIIFSLIMTCVAIGISAKDKTYFLICGSTIFVTLLQISDLGILFPLWPNSIYWNSICGGIFAALSPLFGANLARYYLETKTSTPKADAILRYYSWYLALICIPVAMLQQDFLFLILFGGVSVLIFMPTIVITSIIRIRKGFSPAKIYLAALVLPYVSGLSIFLVYAGVLPTTIFTKLLPLAGTALQLSLFVAALSERINWLKINQSLSMQKETAAKSEMAAKKSFLAHISHELRTPLIGIIGLANLAKKHPIYSNNKLLIDGIDISAMALLDTTNTLLDLARVESGKWKTHIITFNLQETIVTSLSKFKEIACDKNKVIQVNICDHLSKISYGDPDIISRIINEIINYSIFFSDQPTIIFTADSRIKPDNKLYFHITAISFSSYANSTYQDPFELFSIVDTSTTRKQQGLGLGLSLSKKFCELIDGEIGYEIGAGNSLTLWCSIPYMPATDADLIDSSLSHDQQAPLDALQTTPSRVLLAEDDETLRLILSDQLEKIGANFTLYPNGKPLVEEYRLSHQDVGIIILDWNMPICNASQAIAAIREFEKLNTLRPVNIVILSAHDQHSAKEMNFPADIQLLHKPISMESLIRIIPAPQKP